MPPEISRQKTSKSEKVDMILLVCTSFFKEHAPPAWSTGAIRTPLSRAGRCRTLRVNHKQRREEIGEIRGREEREREEREREREREREESVCVCMCPGRELCVLVGCAESEHEAI